MAYKILKWLIDSYNELLTYMGSDMGHRKKYG